MKANKVASTLISLGVIIFLLGFLSRYHWLLEAIANFRMYFLFYFLTMIFISLWARQKWYVVLNTCLVIFIFFSIRPYLCTQTVEKNEEGLSLISANLLSPNTNYQEVIDYIAEENPDVVFFMEVNAPWANALKELESTYTYHKTLLRSDNFGIAIYSKYELAALKIIGEPINQIPSLITDVIYNDKTYHLIGIHPMPPIGFEYFTLRNQHLDRINSIAKEYKENLIMIGDMNCSSFSANFSRITDGTNLKDSRLGFGLQGSWSAKNKMFSFAIDHCLVSENIQVLERKIGNNNGSDHYPVVVKIK